MDADPLRRPRSRRGSFARPRPCRRAGTGRGPGSAPSRNVRAAPVVVAAARPARSRSSAGRRARPPAPRSSRRARSDRPGRVEHGESTVRPSGSDGAAPLPAGATPSAAVPTATIRRAGPAPRRPTIAGGAALRAGTTAEKPRRERGQCRAHGERASKRASGSASRALKGRCYPLPVESPNDGRNYTSETTYVVEFLGLPLRFNAADFEQRVTAAAVKLGLVEENELDETRRPTWSSSPPRAASTSRAARSGATSSATGIASRSSAASRSSTGCASCLPRRVARPPRQGGSARGRLGRRRFGVRLPRSSRRPRAARARSCAELARAAVPRLDARSVRSHRGNRSSSKRLSTRAAWPSATCAMPSSVTTRPRGVRWMNPSWSRYGS